MRRILLWILNAIGAFVGVWALVFPREFYDSFPGLGFGAWATDGPFNEHLIRDVGALYLALVAAGVFAAFGRERMPGSRSASPGSCSPCRTSRTT